MQLDHEKLDGEAVRKGKELLVRIVAMLTRMIERGTQVREGEAVYGYVNENGNVGKSGQRCLSRERYSAYRARACWHLYAFFLTMFLKFAQVLRMSVLCLLNSSEVITFMRMIQCPQASVAI